MGKQSRHTFILLGILLALAILGVGRMKWSARTGSEEFATSLHTLDKATFGLVLDRRTPAESLPTQQLDFWTGEAERIFREHPDDAELHAAAAVMLDQPCLTYLSELISNSIQSNSPWDTQASIQDVLENSRASFDINCVPLVATYARQATELAPDDVLWWRIRATLLWPTVLSTQYDQPREPQWKETLEEARQHDPGNALYDMIELVKSASDTYRFEEGDMLVNDLGAWRRCIELAERISEAPHLTLGEPAMPGLVRLHDLTRHPKATTLESIRHHMLGQRGAMLASQSSRQLMHMSDVVGDLPDQISRIELVELATAIVDLAANRSDATVRHDNLINQMQLIVWQVREKLESASGEVSQQTEQEIEAATQSFTNFVARATAWKDSEVSPVSPLYSVLSAISLALLPVGIVCSLVWLVLWVAGTYGNDQQRHRGWQWGDLRLSPLALLLAILAFCVSYFFWGVGPTNAVSPNSLFGQIMQQNPTALDDWSPGPAWMGNSVMQWLGNDGAKYAGMVFVVLSLISCLWQSSFKEASGKRFVTSSLVTLVMLNIWVWTEPKVYQSTRPKQQRFEQYIRSVDEYYVPFHLGKH